ncbi:MAG TPA: putative porin [Ignavibacteriaceae bacterium]|nr:putative porin [Ignavibacteriaceae bacterium]
MKLLTAAFIVFLFCNVYPQINRADSIGQKDTTKVLPNPLEDTMQDTIATKDTVGILPTVVTPLRNQFHIQPFFGNSFFINKKFIERIDYNHAGEILIYAPFYQVVNLGSAGQNNYLYAYGTASYNVLEDGIPVYNALGLQAMNLIHTEDIDSLEIVSSTQSFILGDGPAINVLSKDFVSDSTYSRLKYFEGTEEEGFIDGVFNALIYKKLNMFINVTNKKVEQGYANSDHDYWQARFKLKYFLSDNINLLATYGYTQFHAGLNGGVGLDSLGNLDEQTLFNEDLAQVYYQNQSEDILNHRFAAKVLFSPNEHSFSDLSFYYQFLKDELNYLHDIQPNYIHQKTKTAGVILRQYFIFKTLNVLLLGNYSNSTGNSRGYQEIGPGLFNLNYEYPVDKNLFFAGRINLTLLDSTLIPSLFLKYGNNDKGGFGASLTYILLNKLQLNFSASSYGINKGNEFTNYEAGITYKNDNDFINLKYLRTEGGTSVIYFLNQNGSIPTDYNTSRNLSGFSLTASNHISKILLEGFANYYFDNISNPIYFTGVEGLNYPSVIPDLNITAGIYYSDILFNNNLDLKAGVKLNYFSNDKNINYKKVFTTDISINGRIQGRAIIFFTWENILDKRYYVVPYYPVRGRNIRFGVSWELFN